MRGKKMWQRLLAFALSLLIIAGTLSGLDFKPKKVHAADATDFRNLVEAVTIDIDGQTVTGDEWKPIYPEVEYTLHLTASETINNADRQFNNTEITYTLPDGFDAKNVNTTITARIVDEKGILILSGNTYVINNNQIGIVWNQTSEEDYQRLVNCGNATVTLDISGTFSADCRELDFGNDVVKTVTVSNDSNVSADKSSYYNRETGRIEYTVTVRSSGHNNNVAITDVVSGSLLTFEPSSVVVSSNKTESVSYSGSTNASGFDFVVPSMVSGEVITVKYSAIVDIENSTGADGMLTAGETQNTVTVVSDEDANNDDNTKTTTNNIRFSSISKEGFAGEDYEEGGKKYRDIAWTIYANEEAIMNIAGTTISDSLISAGTAASAVYSGDGIIVEAYDGSHDPVRSDTISWEDLTASSDSGFTYTVPDSDIALSYEIHYTTKVELTGLSSPTTVKNSAEFKYGTSEQSVGIAPAAGNELGVSKVATNISSEKIDWEIYVHVPEDGINELVVKDELSSIWIHKDDQHKLVYDEIDFDSITVSGITGTESFDYTAQLDSTSGTPSGLTFTFYQEPGVPGIAASESGRDFVISFSTFVDKDWFELYGGDAWSGNHKNTVKVNDQVTATADAIPTEKTVDKIGTLINTIDDNGTELPVYRYDVIISGLDRESFDITDTFDTEHLELVEDVALNPWNTLHLGEIFLRGAPTVENLTKENDTTSGYGQRTYNGTSGSQALSYNTTGTGVVFHVNTDNIPKTGGTYYPHYAITYYLKVKNAAALAELDQLAHENPNACYTFTNTAKALGLTASEDINYSASGLLSKEILNLDELGIDPDSGLETRDAEFRIVFNADGDTWNNGNTIELVDSYTNMSIDFTSIHVEDGAGNDITDEVSYEARGYSITFKVPDNKKIVITYKARINGSSDVTFSNELSYKGSKVETRETKNFSSSEEAQASNFYVTLFKYERGDMTKPLEGAVFELYDAATDEPITIKKEGPDYGKNITFKTGDDGSVQIKGDQGAWGWSLEGNKQYYLKEIKAPTGYQLRDRNLYFSVTQGDPDYDNYVYFIGDIIICRNTPDDSGTGKITVNKTYTSASSTARTFTFGLFTDAEGTTRAVDANNNPIALQSVSITGTGSGTTVTDNTDTVEFTGVPYGTYYVFEVDSEGNALVSDKALPYYISGNGAVAEISEASAEAEVSITNTEKIFSISVSKSLVDEENKELSADDIADIPASISKNFKANITLNDADGNPVNGTFTSGTTTVEFVDGVYTATITAGSSSFTISGIPYGYTYKVEEVTATDFDADHFDYKGGNVSEFTEAAIDQATGDLANQEVTLVNEYIPDVPGSITVNKSYLAQDTEEATFYFALFTDANGSNRAALVSNPQAFYPVKHITLTGDPEEAVSGSVEFDGLETPRTFYVFETDSNGNKLSTTPAMAIRTESAEAALTRDDPDATVTYTNEQTVGSLTLKKTINGNVPNGVSKTFEFDLYLKDPNSESELNGEFTFGDSYSFVDGHTKINVTAGTDVVLTGIPVGYTYEVIEGDPEAVDEHYAYVSGNSESPVAIVFGNQTVTITNSYTSTDGQITVTKNYNAASSDTASRTFYFGLFSNEEGTTRAKDFDGEDVEILSLTLSGPGPDATSTIATGTVNFTNLVYGTYYVFETDSNGNPITSDGDLAFIIDDKDGAEVTISEETKTGTAEFTNTQKTTSLTLGKDLYAEDGTALTAEQTAAIPQGITKTFKFDVYLKNAAEEAYSGTIGGYEFEDGYAQITVTAGETVTISGIPFGFSYKVTENTDSLDSHFEYKSGNMTDYENTASNTFENGVAESSLNIGNTYLPDIEGTITVNKTFEGSVAGENTFYFALFDDVEGKVRSKYWNNNQRVYSEKSVTIVLTEDELTKTESVDFTELDVPRTYYVFETDAEGKAVGSKPYMIIYGNGEKVELTRDDNEDVVNITNTEKVGNITLKKTIQGDVPSGVSKTFEFVITATDDEENPLTGSYTFGDTVLVFDENGIAKVNVTAGTDVLLANIPVGYVFNVVENIEDADSHYSYVSGQTDDGITVSEAGSVVEIVNKYTQNDGTITISKRYDGFINSEDFTFYFGLFSDAEGTTRATYEDNSNVEIKSVTFAKTDPYVSAGTGAAPIRTKAVEFTGLPNGTYYVFETDANGAPITSDVDLAYEIGVSNEDRDAYYAVAELTVDQRSDTAEFDNIAKTYSVTLAKTLVDESGNELSSDDIAQLPSDVSKSFKFNIYLYDENGNAFTGNIDGVEFENGYSQVSIVAGGSGIISGIPYGYTYTIEEETTTNFDSVHFEYVSGNVTAAKGTTLDGNGNPQDIDEEIVNKYIPTVTGSITVNKRYTGKEAGEYTFYFALFNDENGTERTTARLNNQQVLSVQSVTITLGDESLTGTDSTVFSDLAVTEEGKTYYVFETNSDGEPISSTPYMRITGNGAEVTLTKTDKDASADITNALTVGKLIIKKTIQGNPSNDISKEFECTLTMKDELGNLLNGICQFGGDPAVSISFTNGVATLAFSADEPLVIDNIPADYTYTITENTDEMDPHFSYVRGNVETFTSIGVGDSTVEFVNLYSESDGEITVNKTYEATSSVEKTFYFGLFSDAEGTTRAVNVYGDTIALRSLTFAPDASVETPTSSSGEQTAVFGGLPYGTYYVFETDANGTPITSDVDLTYTVSDKDGIEAILSEAKKKAEVSFTNTEKSYSLTISKSLIDEEDKALTADDIAAIPQTISKSFKFIITIFDENGDLYTGSIGSVPFTNGVCRISAGAGNTFVLSGIPYGFTYTVEEVTDTNFDSVHFEYVSGNISQRVSPAADTDGNLANQSVAFVNRYLPDIDGEINLSKMYTGKEAGDYSFYFALFDDADGRNRTHDKDNNEVLISVQKVDITLEAGNLVQTGGCTFRGLYVPKTYYVFETDSNGNPVSSTPYMKITGNGAEIALSRAEYSAAHTIANEDTIGTLTLRKTIEGNVPDEVSKTFDFVIYMIDGAQNPLDGDYTFGDVTLTFENGVARTQVTAGTDVVLKNVPITYSYSVTEDLTNADPGYRKVSESSADVTTMTAEGAVAEIINSYTATDGAITVTKAYAAAAERSRTFYFALFADAEGTERAVDFDEEVIPVRSVTVAGGTAGAAPTGTASFVNLTYGTYYVFETDANGTPILTYADKDYTISDLDGIEVVIDETSKTGTAVFTNTDKTYNLTINKALIDEKNNTLSADDIAAIPQTISKSFKFDLYLYDETGALVNGTIGGLPFEDGVVRISLGAGNTFRLQNIPYGYTYKVVEVTDVNFDSVHFEYVSGNVTSRAGSTLVEGVPVNAEVTVTNMYKPDIEGKITVKKDFLPADTGEYTFYFALFNDEDGTARTTDPNNAQALIPVKSIALTSEQSGTAISGTVDFEGLNVTATGARYYVFETDSNGNPVSTTPYMTIRGNGQEIILTRAAYEAEVDIANVETVGKLTLSKTIDNEDLVPADESKTFPFIISMTDASGNALSGEYTFGTHTLTFENGKTVVNVTAGEDVVISGIPAGYHYMVSESLEGIDHFDCTGGQMDDYAQMTTAGATVTISNIYIPTDGEITVTKVYTATSTIQRTFYFGLFTDAEGTTRARDLYDELIPVKQITFAVQDTASGTGSVKFTNLLHTKYYVFETDANGNAIKNDTSLPYTVSSTSGIEVEITDDATSGTATITNTEKTYGLYISKALIDEEGQPLTAEDIAAIPTTISKSFKFNITIYDENDDLFNGSISYIPFVNGVRQVSLGAGNEFRLTGIPYEYTYKVEEVTESNFDSVHFNYVSGDVTTATGTEYNTDGSLKNQEVTITNMYKPDIDGAITVNKEFTGAAAGDYTFYFALFDDENGEYRTHDKDNNQALVSVKSLTVSLTDDSLTGEASVVFDSLATTEAGRTYYVFETDSNGNPLSDTIYMTITGNGANVTLTRAANEKSVEIENEETVGSLTLRKTINGAAPETLSKTFQFVLTMYDENGDALNGAYTFGDTTLTFSEGSTTIDVTEGTDVVITHIPVSYTYTVVEDTTFMDEHYSYISGAVENPAQISKNGTTVNIVNKYTQFFELYFAKLGIANEACSEYPDETEALAGITFAAALADPETGELLPRTYVRQATSDEDGVVSFGELQPGTYRIWELEADAYHILDENTYYAVITEETGFVGIATDYLGENLVEDNRLVNETKMTDLTFTKVSDKDEAKTIGGSKYGLYKEDENGELQKVAERFSDEKGVVTFEGVFLDTPYTVMELVAPDGYRVSERPVIFEYDEDEDGNYRLKVTAVDTGDGTIKLLEDGTVVWLEPEVIVSFNKVDEDGKGLAGATLQVEDENGNVVYGPFVTTGETVTVTAVFTEGKTYKLVEVSAPDGYDVAAPVEFTIPDTPVTSEDNEPVVVTMTDKKTPTPSPTPSATPTPTPSGPKPKTGDDTNAGSYIFLAFASLLGFGILGLKKRKEEEEA